MKFHAYSPFVSRWSLLVLATLFILLLAVLAVILPTANPAGAQEGGLRVSITAARQSPGERTYETEGRHRERSVGRETFLQLGDGLWRRLLVLVREQVHVQLCQREVGDLGLPVDGELRDW